MKFLIVFLLMLTGCATQTKVEYRDVMVPTPAKIDVPAELAEPSTLPAPQFVAPDHPQAVAAMTEEQTQVFKRWALFMRAQLDGFRVLLGLDKPP